MGKYEYPECYESDLVEDHFGYKLPCPYTWLRDTNSEKVLDFTKRENDFTDKWFSSFDLEKQIAELKEEHISELPSNISKFKDGYIGTYSTEGNYTIVYLDNKFNIVKTLFKRYDFPKYTPFSVEVCPNDDNYIAIMAQVDGAPRPDYLVYDVKDEKVLATLPLTFSGQWSKEGIKFYCASTHSKDDSSKTTISSYDVKSNETKEVFTYPEYSIFGNVFKTSSANTMMFSFCADYSNSVYYVYDEKNDSLKCINDKALELIYLDSLNDKHYFISLIDSEHGQVVEIENNIEDAKSIYAPSDAYLESGFVLKDKIYLMLNKDAASILYCLSDNKQITLPSEVCCLTLTGENKDYVLFSIDSFTSSHQLLKFDCDNIEELTEAKKKSSNINVELKKAKSKDGTEIPYYLVSLKDVKKDGNNPALMYGYGGYNISMPPQSVEVVSQTNIIDWVSKGGVYVHALLRGGNEYGSKWHLGGMGKNKKNCYYDFIAIAEDVMKQGYSKPGKFAISGCSNGGLLMSTLVTMRPDLWGCVIDSVPHTDMIHFVEDDRGPMYITEYGDPRESKEMFEYFLSYSPVHNVKDVDYPPTYIQTGDCDNNVPPYHGKGFAAMMQKHNTSDNPILLRVLKYGSHDRGQGEVFWKTIGEMHLFIKEALHI